MSDEITLTQSAPLPVEGMSPVSRAAAVVVALGAEAASSVYKYLSEEEIESISLEVARLKRLSPEELDAVMEDFYGLCVTQKVISDGGVDYARNILEKAFGSQRASSYMERITQAMQERPFEFVRKASYRGLLVMLQNEHPQTIALVLSYARSEQASQVISQLSREVQLDVIERIAKLESVSPEIVEIVERVLEKRFSVVASDNLTEIGGVNYVADIMNHTDRTTEKRIFDELGQKDPELSESIRKLMFVFEDIVKLDDLDIQRFLRDVDSQDLAVAIKGSTDEVKQVLLSNMSKRAQENMLTDIEYLHNIRMRDVEEAQQRIVNVIRSLEEAGEITISRGGDEIIA